MHSDRLSGALIPQKLVGLPLSDIRANVYGYIIPPNPSFVNRFLKNLFFCWFNLLFREHLVSFLINTF